MNAGLLVDLPHLGESGAEGIGLFRTELQFMIAETMPRMSEQKALYGEVLKAAGDQPVTFRTLDIGADKVLPYMPTGNEENPAMGWRAIRIGLDRPGLLEDAAARAAAGRRRARAARHAADGDRARRGQADPGDHRPRTRPDAPPRACRADSG